MHEPLDEHERWRLVQHEPLPAARARPAEDENGVRRKGAAQGAAAGQGLELLLRRPRSSRSPRPSSRPPTTTVPRTRRWHEAASPEWDRELHGGADERAETDAYAPHEHENGEASEGREAREADPDAETSSTR